MNRGHRPVVNQMVCWKLKLCLSGRKLGNQNHLLLFLFLRNQTICLGLYWNENQINERLTGPGDKCLQEGLPTNPEPPSKSFAFLARTLATTLQSLLTWLNSRNWKSAARTRMSSMTFPYEEKQPSPCERALITTDESPSKVTFWSPSYLANWIALRQAIASTSFTDWVRGMGMGRTPITAPRQSRAMSPMPTKFSELNTAASKFNLKWSASGGCHCYRTGGRGEIGSNSWAARNSYNKLPTMEQRFPRGWIGWPKCWVFLRFQINQAVIEKISELNSSCTRKNLENKSEKSDGGEVTAWWNHVNEFHKQAISLQDQVAFILSSSWLLHNSHTIESVIWRRRRLVMVGNALWQALQMKCWIFFWHS